MNEVHYSAAADAGVLTDVLHAFTFMHLTDAFIQSDLHCIEVTVFTFFLSAFAFPGNRTHDLGVASAMLYYLMHATVCRLD